MAKLIWGKELEKYASWLAMLGEKEAEVCGKTIYEMANIAANEVKNELNGLHAISDAEGIKRYKKGERAELTYKAKQGLIDSFGISRLQNDGGFRNVKLGFDGYNTVRTEAYPKGQPNILIARSVESGTYFMDKQPFMRPAIKAAKSKCLKKAQETFDKEVKKIMEG